MNAGVVDSGNPAAPRVALTCSELPLIQQGNISTLSAKVKEFRAATKSLDSISVFSDLGSDNLELCTALESIGDPDTKLVLNILTKMMQDMEKKLFQKMASQIEYLESAFTRTY